MEHSLWVIGDNRIVALSEIRNVSPTKEGSTIYFKDGSKESIGDEETNNLVKAVMLTQKGGQPQPKRNNNFNNRNGVRFEHGDRNERPRDWS